MVTIPPPTGIFKSRDTMRRDSLIGKTKRRRVQPHDICARKHFATVAGAVD
jgi:hypothetical protein